MTRLVLRCPPLDDLLGGGLEVGIVTKLFGGPGTGKTNLCLQAAREMVAAGRKVVYIDSEGVSVERLRQLCTETDFSKVLRSILFYHPVTFSAQETMIGHAIQLQGIGLVVVDSLNKLYRARGTGGHEGRTRSFVRQMTTLQVAASEQDLAILVTEQVYTDSTGAVQPFTRRNTEPMVKTILRLDWKEPGVREATLLKHRSLPVGSSAVFSITATGLS